MNLIVWYEVVILLFQRWSELGSVVHMGVSSHKGYPGVTPKTCGAIGTEGPNDPSVGEGPKRWERLPPTEIRSHEGKAICCE